MFLGLFFPAIEILAKVPRDKFWSIKENAIRNSYL